MSAQSPSILELARNRARNSRATQAEIARNKQANLEPDLLRNVALDEMPNLAQLNHVCRLAVIDYPAIDAARLQKFLEVAQDPAWCSERVARLIARRMSEGVINERR